MGESADLKCLQVGATQYGLLHRSQALELGLTRHQIAERTRSGRWQRLYPSVYRIEGSPRTWHQSLKGLCLWAERGFALSHESAAALWGLARFPRGALEVTLTRDARLRGGVQVHRTLALSTRDIASMDGLRVTSPTRTLLDLSKVQPLETLRASLDECLRRRLTTLEKLATALERTEHHSGLTALRQLVADYQGGELPAESELEARVFELIDASALPRPGKQRCVVVGGKLRRLDFLYAGPRIVIEALGYRWHGQQERWKQDLARANALTARGFRVLHWTWDALEDEPARLVGELRAMLGDGNWGASAPNEATA